jgi:sodium transport system permease protein
MRLYMAEILPVLSKSRMKLLTIIKKELIDQVRDKRTIIAAILMPAVIVPLLLLLIPYGETGGGGDIPIKIIMQNNDSHIKSLILASYPDSAFIEEGTAGSVLNGEADLYIEFIKTGNRYSSFIFHYDSARTNSVIAFVHVHDLFDSIFSREAPGSGGTELRGSAVRSEAESRTLHTLALMLPVFLMVFAASSTMSSVIDMTAGEKERLTIEILLSCSIPRSILIAGKIIAASIIGFFSITSLITGLTIFSQVSPGITGGLSLLGFAGFKSLLSITLMAFMNVFLFAAAGLVIGLYAKSVKEGGILSLPFIIASSALSSGFIGGDPFRGEWIFLLMPVLNFSSLIRSAIFNHYDLLNTLIAFSVNMAWILFFVAAGGYLIKKGDVVFRS